VSFPRGVVVPVSVGRSISAWNISRIPLMLEAIREAEASIAQGGLPIGAVLTRDKQDHCPRHNNRVQENNVILHGEMSCLREAERSRSTTQSCTPRCRHAACVPARSLCSRSRWS